MVSSKKKKKSQLPTKYPRKIISGDVLALSAINLNVFRNKKQVSESKALGTMNKEISAYPSQSSVRAESNTRLDFGAIQKHVGRNRYQSNETSNLFAQQFFQPNVQLSATNIGGSIRPKDTVIQEKDLSVSYHKEHEHREAVPMTFIPFENIACCMDKSDIEKYFRQMFYGHLKHVENQFEKFIAETNLNYKSFQDFFRTYIGVGYENGVARTEVAQIRTEIKLEKSLNRTEEVDDANTSDFELVPDYATFESEVDVAGSPEK